MKTVALLFAIFLACVSSTYAQDFRGLRSITVNVALLGDTQRGGLSQSQVQNDVELQLRKAAIPVGDSDTDARLNITVTSLRFTDTRYVADVRVMILEPASLERNPRIKKLALVWARAQMIVADGSDRLKDVRSGIEDMVNFFANEYLKDNPKSP